VGGKVLPESWRSRWKMRFHIISVIGKRDFLISFRTFWFYGALLLSLLIASFSIASYLAYVEQNGLLVIKNPLFPPLIIVTLVGAGYLGLWAAISMATERIRGTLEVLFYGPVDVISFILGKSLGLFGVYPLIMLGWTLYIFYASLITRLPLPEHLPLILLLSSGLVLDVIGFGALLSVLLNSIRSTALMSIAIFGLSLAIPLGEPFWLEWVAYPIRQQLSSILALIRWISPFTYLWQGLLAIEVGDFTSYVFNLFAGMIYAGFALGLACYSLRRKGVRRP